MTIRLDIFFGADLFYTIYKITNTINGKIYIGKHQTHNLDNSYMGSGKHLRRSISKYGIVNFTKEILHIFETVDEMNAKERELVTEDFCNLNDTYNICEGGHGGFGYVNQQGLNVDIKEQHRRNPDLIIKTKKHSKEALRVLNQDIDYREKQREKLSKTVKAYYDAGGVSGFKNRTHTKDTRLKMSVKHRKRLQDPTKNSQYGSKWITNGIENKKIKKIDIIPEGYYSGRTY